MKENHATLRYDCRPTVTRRMYPDSPDRLGPNCWALVAPPSQAHAATRRHRRRMERPGQHLQLRRRGAGGVAPVGLVSSSLMEKYPSEECNSERMY